MNFRQARFPLSLFGGTRGFLTKPFCFADYSKDLELKMQPFQIIYLTKRLNSLKFLHIKLIELWRKEKVNIVPGTAESATRQIT